MSGILPERSTGSSEKSFPSLAGTKGNICLRTARPASRFVPAVFSLRALEPRRANRSLRSSMKRWTSLSRDGILFWFSAAHKPPAVEPRSKCRTVIRADGLCPVDRAARTEYRRKVVRLERPQIPCPCLCASPCQLACESCPSACSAPPEHALDLRQRVEAALIDTVAELLQRLPRFGCFEVLAPERKRTALAWPCGIDGAAIVPENTVAVRF